MDALPALGSSSGSGGRSSLLRTVRVNTAAPRAAARSILMIYTGGTLGMVFDAAGTLVPFDFEGIMAQVPELHRFDFELTVVTPEPPIDSSNVTPAHWLRLARLIFDNYSAYDGFVVLHGTDTMAYSASALSFLLEGLAKPVVFTGAQLPIGAVRTDARQNLATALEIAAGRHQGQPTVPEVCILFDNQLLRGNRAKKAESSQFDAFHSENYPPLATAGIGIEYNFAAIVPTQPDATFSVATSLDERVALLRLFPGISPAVVRATVSIPDLRGLVLETYGAGNAPTADWFTAALAQAIDQGVMVMNVSQCPGGRVVPGKYATSQHLVELGVLSGADITTEAAITKLMYVLGQNHPPAETARRLTSSLRGELTP